MAAVIYINGRARRLVARNRVVEEHAWMVPQIAKHVGKQLPPCFDLDDLIDAGWQGLLKARDRYDPEQHGNTPFKYFAKHHIRGAILDSVRRKHWTDATHEPLTFRGDGEDGNGDNGAEAIAEPGATPDHVGDIAIRRSIAVLREAMGWLTEPGRSVVRLYYLEDWRLPDIAAELGLPESRIPVLRDTAIAELRRRLSWKGLTRAA